MRRDDATVQVRWRKSWRADPVAVQIADRHYNRQKPGSAQFVPPGSCLVLMATEGVGLWVTSWPIAEYTQHRWAGAWVNSLYRRESGPLASEMIREAVAATRWYYGEPPELGMVTFVDPDKVKSRNPGYAYLMAGFERDGETQGGLLAFRMRPENMPEPDAPVGAEYRLFAG